MASFIKGLDQRTLNLSGITTNNLKNISVSLPHQALIGITGVSGGGKSSLAYDTIYAICRQEFDSVEKGYHSEASFSVKYADGLIPAVAVKQKNENTNPRSNIYTYLNLGSYLPRPSSRQALSYFWELTKITKPSNQCPRCEGLGNVRSLDVWALIDQSKTLSENPFIAWKKTNNNKFHALLLKFCEKESIKEDVPFKELGEKTKDLLLTTVTDERLEFSFKIDKKAKKRKEHYVGYEIYLKQIERSNSKSNRNFMDKFSSTSVCPECSGSTLNKERYQGFEVGGVRFDDLLLKPVDDLLGGSRRVKDPYALGHLSTLLEAIGDLGIGYLNLSRSIPSLSGGELQKLRLAKLKASSLQNIGVVLDEVSSGVHPAEYQGLKDLFVSVSKRNNLVILIEHNGYFLSHCDEVFELGPGSGSDGGRYIPYRRKELWWYREKGSVNEFDVFSDISKNNVKGLTIGIPRGCMTAIVGISGSGKSSVASYLEENYDYVSYVSQKQIKDNVRSSVSTYLELGRPISEFYAKSFNFSYDHFLPSAGNPWVCSECDGAGLIRFERSFDDDVEVVCPKCEGGLFDEKASSYRISGVSISELYDLSLENVSDAFDSVKRLRRAQKVLGSLGLGYLSLNRKTKSLSGGELRRLKLAKALLTPNRRKILVVDEPSAGLDANSLGKMVAFLDECKNEFRSIMIVEHRVEAVASCDYLIEMGPGAGERGGEITYTGGPDEYVFRYKAFSDLGNI